QELQGGFGPAQELMAASVGARFGNSIVGAAGPGYFDGRTAGAPCESLGLVETDPDFLHGGMGGQEHGRGLFGGHFEESILAEAQQGGDLVGDLGIVSSVVDIATSPGAR